MPDSEHHWVVQEMLDSPGLYQACPLIINDDGTVDSIMVGLTLITSLDGLKERAWTVTEVDDINDPVEHHLLWAAEGHGVKEGPE